MNNRTRFCSIISGASALCILFHCDCFLFSNASFSEIRIPHAQKAPPGPAKTPEEARQHFTLPEGFHAQLVAAEPIIVNPVAMTWDDRGRIWVCESVEYPRFEEGPGKDRIRIHEDLDGDGASDRVTPFADGLNIPSGVAVGYGGVFVANSPDLLFMRDLDGDDRADTTEVLLTGFGRKDVHELPNCLTWGPDGWLYGLNGVFNPSKIVSKGETHEFTCALWRYHPVTRDFDLFARGTSNPWGLDYNRSGHWFVSACVIDHLWHLSQSGYYHRQSGVYPPNVWKMGSIVNHKHQMAAYCGLAFYDADVYPAEYHGDLVMGNIHFGGINRDRLQRNGATYDAEARDDFMAGNDPWHMPVSQNVGPDGCLWVLDWYDRYHCYQDARRDPEGIDRLSGRLWRIVYGDCPLPPSFDLQEFNNAQLIQTLSHPNVWWRRKARRILTERNEASSVGPLERSALSGVDGPGPVEALWTLVSMRRIGPQLHATLLSHENPVYRSWGVRAAAEAGIVSTALFEKLKPLAKDSHPDVRLEIANASSRVKHPRAFNLLLSVMEHPEEDPILPHIVWENFHPRLGQVADHYVDWLASYPVEKSPIADPVSDRGIDLLLASALNGWKNRDQDGVIYARALRLPLSQGFRSCLIRPWRSNVKSVSPKVPGRSSKNLQSPFHRLVHTSLSEPAHTPLAKKCLKSIWNSVRSGQLDKAGKNFLNRDSRDLVSKAAVSGSESGSFANFILTAWGDESSISLSKRWAMDPGKDDSLREGAFEALAIAGDREVIDMASAILAEEKESADLKKGVLNSLMRLESPEIGERVVSVWDRLPQRAISAAVNLLSSRAAWAKALLESIENETIPRITLNANLARRILAMGNEPLSKKVRTLFGDVRVEDRKDWKALKREKEFVLSQGDGDPVSGQALFKQACAQCHRMYGFGREVGPDITENGRDNLDQILSNLLDPNLVIGSGYLSWMVLTKDEQTFTGLLVEDSSDQVILKLEGEEYQTIPRDEIESIRQSEVSLMPEQLDTGMTDQQFRDLIGFLRSSEPAVPWEQLEKLETK